jgi:TPR repeat protein
MAPTRSLAKHFITAGLLLLSLDVCAKELDDAVEAMRAGDFAEAYCIMRPLAEAGDADAQYNIGWMYHNGYGLRTNETLALQWWEKASEQGNADASLSIGMLYSLGEGDVARDMAKAIDYYLLAAAGGEEDAVTMLQSMMLRNDKGIRGRLHSIMDQHGALFGEKLQVKAKKLNARSEPTVESMIVASLLQGDSVLELYRQGRWSQVVILGNKEIDRTVWVYNPLLEDTADMAAEQGVQSESPAERSD